MGLTKEQNEALKQIDNDNAIAAFMHKVRDKHFNKFSPVHQMGKIRESEIEEIEFIRLPKEGGIHVYFVGHPYPRKGFPIAEAQETIDIAKKNFMAVLSGFRDMFSSSKIKTIFFVLFFRKQIIKGLDKLVTSVWRQVRMYKLQERYYCTAVYELLRTLHIMKNMPGRKRGDLFGKIINIVALILEFDDAYRYRFQDTFGRIDKEKPLFPQLEQAVERAAQAEKSSRVAGTWKALQLVLKIARYYRPLKKEIELFFEILHIEEIKLTVEDYYFAKFKKDFAWQGPPNERSFIKSLRKKDMPEENVNDTPQNEEENADAEAPAEAPADAEGADSEDE